VVVDLAFQFGIEIDMKSFLQQQAFKQQYGWIGIGAFTAGPNAVVVHQHRVDTIPIDETGNVTQSLEATIFIHGIF
jgi:hypothetical protein